MGNAWNVDNVTLRAAELEKPVQARGRGFKLCHSLPSSNCLPAKPQQAHPCMQNAAHVSQR
jgi:hypothetical protein